LRELRPERSASANSAIRAQASFYIAGFLSATNPVSGGGRHAGAMLRDSFFCGIVLNVYVRTDNLR